MLLFHNNQCSFYTIIPVLTYKTRAAKIFSDMAGYRRNRMTTPLKRNKYLLVHTVCMARYPDYTLCEARFAGRVSCRFQSVYEGFGHITYSCFGQIWYKTISDVITVTLPPSTGSADASASGRDIPDI